MADSLEHPPTVTIKASIPHISDWSEEAREKYLAELKLVGEALASLFAVVIAHPEALLNLFCNIIKTSAEMFREEVKPSLDERYPDEEEYEVDDDNA